MNHRVITQLAVPSSKTVHAETGERGRETETQRGRDRDTARERDRDTARERDRDTARERDRKTARERDIHSETKQRQFVFRAVGFFVVNRFLSGG